ncbi:MAG: patatin-like phospholipase family protein [Bacteriovoracaceae bacterium]
MQNLGIVLTGGGARASYQVGALRALYEIIKPLGEGPVFDYLAGTSAGAINTAYLAAFANDYDLATKELIRVWSNLSPEEVYKTNPLSLSKIGARWISGSVFGGLKKEGSSFNYLLDNGPLRNLLTKNIDMIKVRENIHQGTIKGMALTATNYFSGASVIFYDSHKEVKPWYRSDRFGLRTTFGVDHILGSSAIPFFFPPTKIGESFYGDGCVRQTTPVSPCIHLGAQKIIAVGIRHLRAQERTVELTMTPQDSTPGLAQISGVTLNSVFLDSLESDVERMERINQTLKKIPDHPELRSIPVLMLRPSQDLGLIAGQFVRDLPRTMRYLLKGIGASEEEGTDLISYLAFDRSFTSPLVDLGYHDTYRRKKEIEAFMEA